MLALAVALSACTPSREPAPTAAPGETAGAGVAQRPGPEPASPPVASLSPAMPGSPSPTSPIVVPADAVYVCVSAAGGAPQQTTIEFAPNVGELCRRHPEMGPCQYERDVCRRSGGRVYAADGKEITRQTEAEYDKKVMRVRLKAN